jgi:nucleoside phosphorylase
MPLILVPTAYEAELLNLDDVPVVVCGFGLAAAGAGASYAIGLHPREAAEGLILVGAAGSYDPRAAPLGRALIASAVRVRGVGVGYGAGHRTAAQLGWADTDVIPLNGNGGELLSVAAASASLEQAAARAARNLGAVGEEMEGYAVAMAAHLHGVPLRIVRGFSNVAGDREHDRWRMDEALAAARETVAGMLG